MKWKGQRPTYQRQKTSVQRIRDPRGDTQWAQACSSEKSQLRLENTADEQSSEGLDQDSPVRNPHTEPSPVRRHQELTWIPSTSSRHPLGLPGTGGLAREGE